MKKPKLQNKKRKGRGKRDKGAKKRRGETEKGRRGKEREGEGRRGKERTKHPLTRKIDMSASEGGKFERKYKGQKNIRK